MAVADGQNEANHFVEVRYICVDEGATAGHC